MKAKYFLTGLVMAAVLCCISCSNKTKTEEPSKTDQYLPHDEIVELVDDDVLTVLNMYRYSDARTIINHRGNLSKDDVDFGSTHISHYACLFLTEDGKFLQGFVNISTRGIALKVGKSFFFYNALCLKEHPMEVKLSSGIVLKDGTVLPAKVEVNGKDQPYYMSIERKDNDVLTYKPLRGDCAAISVSVKQMKDFCKAHKLTDNIVPFLKFDEVNKIVATRY